MSSLSQVHRTNSESLKQSFIHRRLEQENFWEWNWVKTQFSWGNNMKDSENKGYLLQLCPLEANPYFQSSNCQRHSINTTHSPSKSPKENLLLPLGQPRRFSFGSLPCSSQKFPSLYSLRLSTWYIEWNSRKGYTLNIMGCTVKSPDPLPPQENSAQHQTQHPGQSEQAAI